MSAGGESEPNLTPFIDLFSVLTCFLLLTAAWIQLESINVKVGPLTAALEENPSPPPPPKLSLSVDFKDASFLITKNKSPQTIRWTASTIKESLLKLSSSLRKIKKEFSKEDIDVTLKSSSNVKYGDLILVYDTIVSSGWSKVAISPY